jgi:ADP-heptose:LPS heptosyltransferase
MLLGDAVVAIPALQRLREHYPRASITVGVQPGAGAASLLAEAGLVDEVLELDHLSPPSRGGQLRQASAFLARGFDAVLSGTRWFVLREAFYSGAPRILTFDDGHPLQRLGTHVLPFDPALHESDNNVALVDALAASPPSAASVPPRLPDPDPEARAAAERLVERLAPGRAPLLVFHPGAQKASRRWPASRFAALAEALLRKHPGGGVVFTGMDAEAGLIEDILARVPEPLRVRAASAAGETTLPVLFALLRAADVVVCNDTGVMHAARACGADLVALLGPENHRRWGPHPGGWGRCIALRTLVPCAPCNLVACEPHFCMRSLGVEAVAAAVEGLLAGEPGAPSSSSAAPGGARIPEATATPDDAAYDLRLSTRGWRNLDDAGFHLPAVTVLCAPGAEPPADLGLHYPVDRVAVRPVAAEDAGHGEDAWLRAIRSGAGDLVALRDPDDGWTGAGLARAVAEAVRRPDGDAWISEAPDRPTLVRAGVGGIGEDAAAALVRSWLDRDPASRATPAGI